MSDDPPHPFAERDGRVRLRVRVTPRASRETAGAVAVDADGCAFVPVRLTAPPVEGAANAALAAFLARALRLRKSEVVIASGETSRQKTVEFPADSATTERLRRWLEGLG
ncbi:DUF167 family protein [Hansschlegelia beijingensis]|uniref:UPF0235 protein GGR24_001845 n=1 Tax=Hansschlegelia beijingensis TaxID=1133344 RepID=A0A7W6GFJ8_9HYPH|nr:hypothetical protein [Hansschlegelia beijingensis]